jgi:Methyltransferase domain
MDLIERPGRVVRRHPWEVARARFFIRLIERLGLSSVTDGWLDVGAGDAWFAQQLRAVLPPTTRFACWDANYPVPLPVQWAEAFPGIEFSADRPPGLFGGVLMLDVIEHVEDDVGFVRDVVEQSLAPDGWVLVSVPAYQALFTSHDRALKHFRRYAPGAIAAVLRRAGLEVQARGGLFHGLLPLRGVQAVRERYRPPAPSTTATATGIGAWEGGARLTKVVTLALETEARGSLALAARSLPSPPGLSTWALCRRRAPGPL